jgi:hypothetical protein
VQLKRPTRVLTLEEKRGRRKLLLIGSGVTAAILGGFILLVLVAGGGSGSHDTGQVGRASQAVTPPPATLTRASTPTTEAPRVLPAALIVLCGKDNGKQQDQKKAPGYDYKLVQGQLFDGWDAGKGAVNTHCWADEKELIFDISMPKGTGGLLHLVFVDGDKLGRKQTLFVQGKQFGGVYENFVVAEQVDVPVPAAEAEQGKVTVKVVNQAGKHNAVVSVIEFSPYARR